MQSLEKFSLAHREGKACWRGVALRIRGLMKVVVVWVGAGIGAVAAPACTLSLDISAVQCRRNQDCAKFVGSVCDTAARICRPLQNSSGTGGNGGGPGIGGAAGKAAVGGTEGGAGGAAELACRGSEGCLPCGAATPSTLQNRCTDVTCVPFDNRTRLTNLGADGGLTPLP